MLPDSTKVVRRVVLALLVVVAFCIPWEFEDYQIGLFCAALYWTVAVLSLNVLTGLSGQISIGHAAFLGIGAYTVAILVVEEGWPYWAAMIAAVLVTSLAGTIISIPALRLRGLYAALTTLGIALVFPSLILKFDSVTGGAAGKSILQPLPQPFNTGLSDQQWVYLVLLVLTLISLVLALNVKRSRVGRAMMAVRDQDLVAESFGVSPARVKITAFAFSSALAGLAGAMFAVQQQAVSSDDFNLGVSITLLVGMAIAGSTSILPAVVGGLFLQFVPNWTRETGLPPVLSPFVYGIILIVFTIMFRNGVVGELTIRGRRLVELVENRRTTRTKPAERGAQPESR